MVRSIDCISSDGNHHSSGESLVNPKVLHKSKMA